MFPIRYLLAMLILLATITSGAGCAVTPEDRWYQQREALNTANQVYLANVPLMDDDTIVRRGELLQAARAALDQAQSHLSGIPGGGSAFDAAMDVVEAILKQLAQPNATITHQEEPAHDLR